MMALHPSGITVTNRQAAPGNQSYIAETQALRVGFNRGGEAIHALRGVDLRIAPGEIVGLVGESGSGKTVLGLSILGLLPTHAQVTGSVQVAGVDLTTADPATRRRVRRSALGAVFQDPMSSLNPTMRIGRQVAEAAGSEAEAMRLLEAVGVPDASRRVRAFPHELSGGQRQRVMLAMALGGNPKLVVADEPTTALDVTIQAQVLALLQHVRDEFGCAILLITHDLAVAATVADRLCVMYAGRVVELGAASDVLPRPDHPYTASLLAARITLRANRQVQLPIISGEPPDPRGEPEGCAFAPRCPFTAGICLEQRPALLPAARHAGVAACHLMAGNGVARQHAGDVWPRRAEGKGGAQVQDLTVRFSSGGLSGRRRTFEALRGVSLTVAPGESVAVVGESGSGKTTLLRVLAGLQQPVSGRVSLLGRAVRPQMVFQDAGASLTPWLTVGAHLEERVRHLPKKERLARVVEVLGRFGLPREVAHARPHELSGGQRQRVALARVVIDPPELLLCDEPISALDVSLAANVLNMLGRLRHELGFAMVFVTHDLAAARFVADRIVVMAAGEIVEEGSPDQVVSAPTHPYTRTLLAAVPDVGAWQS